MAVKAQLYNGEILEFPDGTDESVIRKTVATQTKIAQSRDRENEFRASVDPTKGMSGGKKFLAGVGKTMTDYGEGVKQMLGMVGEDEVAARRERDKALMDTGAGMVGGVAGHLAVGLPTALIPGAGTIRGATAISGALGAAMPTVEGESRGRNAAIAALLGGGTTAGIKGVGKLKDLGGNVLHGITGAGTRGRVIEMLGEAADAAPGGRASVLAALRSPGDDLLTAGQKAAPAQASKLSSLLRLSEGLDDRFAAAIPQGQDDVINQGLAKAAGTRALRSGLASQRSAAAGPKYQAVRASQEFAYPKQSMDMLDDLISKSAGKGKKYVAPLKSLRKDLDITWGQAQKGGVKGYLMNVRDQVDDMLRTTGKNGKPKYKHLSGELNRLKKTLASDIGDTRLAEADDTFRAFSKRLDRRNVMSEIQERMEGSTDKTRERLLSKILGDKPKTNRQVMKAAGAEFRDKGVAETVNPGDIKLLQRARDLFKARTDYDKLAKTGLGSAKSLLDDMDVSIPHVLERNIVVINTILEHTGKNASKRSLTYLAGIADDPAAVATFIAKAKTPGQKEAARMAVDSVRNMLSYGAGIGGAETVNENL